MLKNKNTIIFDFDGTLVDTMHIFADVASQLISENYNVPRERARQMYFETSGLPFCQQMEIMFPGHNLNTKIASAYEMEKMEAISDIGMDYETREALLALKSLGYNLAISSNNYERNIVNFVNNNRLSDIFTPALGFRQEGFGKGKPHFDFIKNELGVEDREMVFVGDALNDAKIAKESGLDFIAKLGTFNKKDFMKFDKNIKYITDINGLLYGK